MSGSSSLISAIARSSRFGLEVLASAVEVGEVRDPERAFAAQSAMATQSTGTFAAERGASRRESAVRGRRYPRSGARAVRKAHRFQAYRGTEPPRFANRIELECARILDWYGIPWDVRADARSCSSATTEGRVTRAFTPDFYLPEQDLYIEVTVMKQSLVTRKNRKLRELRRALPGRQRQALLPARHRAPRPAIPAEARLVSRPPPPTASARTASRSGTSTSAARDRGARRRARRRDRAGLRGPRARCSSRR